MWSFASLVWIDRLDLNRYGDTVLLANGTSGAHTVQEIGKCIDMRRHAPVLGLPDEYAHQFAHNAHHATDAAIFETLVAGVDESIAEVDAVFCANGLARMTTTQIHAQMRLDPGDTAMRVEICATKALPFSVHDTGVAVWNHYRFAKQRMPSRYYSYHSLKVRSCVLDVLLLLIQCSTDGLTDSVMATTSVTLATDRIERASTPQKTRSSKTLRSSSTQRTRAGASACARRCAGASKMTAS